MGRWIPINDKMPKRFQSVWITRKNKTREAYLDGGAEPRWHFLNNSKTVAYDEATAWMEIEMPEPYKGEKK